MIKNDNSIRRLDLFNESSSLYEEVIPPMVGVKQITSLAYNQMEKSLYFATIGEDHESQIYILDGKSIKRLYHGTNLKHIAYDWVTGNIYYAVNGTFNTFINL